MIYQAHKGVSTENPENTMPAFVSAVKQGYDVIELDVSVTKDLEFVTLHDKTINRTARQKNGELITDGVEIKDIIYEDLLNYDFGIWFSEEFAGTKIPLFEDVLLYAKQKGIKIKIDNKYQKFNQVERKKFFKLLKPYENIACLTCSTVEELKSVKEIFPNMYFHYDGLVTSDILEEISKFLPIVNDNIYVLRNGRWQNMFRPVNPDRPFSGVNLAESFADLCSKEFNVSVGLIPCADGGTSLCQWMPGEILFDNAVYQAKLAKRTSTIAGVLWHQGEADCRPDRYPVYAENCLKMFESIKKELEIDVPFIVGGLGDFLADKTDSEYLKNYPFVNAALHKMADENDYIGYVPAEGLTSNPDNLHFNAKSLRDFGKRYFDVFNSLNTVIKKSDSTVEALSYTEMERL